MDLLKNIFKGDKVIWIIFLCLCLISIIEVFSAASTLTYKSGDHWGPITQHSIILMVGAVVVVFLHNVPYKWFQVFPVFLYPVSLVLLAFVTLMGIITGDRVNGAARWMTFMGLQFQPSELAKMAVIIAVSFILSKRQDEYGANPNAFKYIMILTGLVFLLIAPENLSTAMLLFGVVCMMMFIGRISSKKLFGMLGILGLVGGVAVGILMAIPAKTLHNTPGLHRFETWQNRVSGFFEKEEVPAAKFDIDKDAQIAHARIAIATSHVVGKGPGNSIQRDFLSQAFSDFIFAIVIEEMGLVGGIFVVFLYLWLLMRAGRIAQKCERTFPAFLVMGIALLLVTGNTEYDGCRRVIPRHRTAPASGQQRRYKYVNQLRLYRNDIKRKPIYRSSGRTESARCTDPTANRGGCRSQFGSTGRSRTDSADSEQRRQI